MASLSDKAYRLDELMPLFREQLALGNTVRFSPRGTSMLPMLRHGLDQVVLSPLPEKLKKYDLPLYQRNNGQYVLHRIVGADGDGYICLGDNQFQKERGLSHEQMIGLVTAFSRNGKEYSVSDWRYKLYCKVWYGTRHLRRFWRRGMGFLRRLIK